MSKLVLLFAKNAILELLKPIVAELTAKHEKRIVLLEREAHLIFKDVQAIAAHQLMSSARSPSDSKLPLN